MRFRDIAFRNLSRCRGRTAFLVLSLALVAAVIVLVASLAAAMRAGLESRLTEYGANLVIVPRSMEMPLSYGGVNIAAIGAPVAELTEEDAILAASIEQRDSLRGLSPKLVGAARVEGYDYLLIGVRFRDELKMKPWWHIQGDEPSLSRDLLLGFAAAKQLGKRAGDTLPLFGKEFRVVGVLDEQSSADDRAIFADLRETGLLLGQPGKVSFIEASTLCAYCPIDTVVAQISAKLPQAKVIAVKQLVEAQLAQLDIATKSAISLIAVIVVIGSLLVLSSMLSALRERTPEIGVLLAMGFRRGHITRLIMLESTVISLVGGALGAITGSVAALFLANRLDASLGPVFSPKSIAMAIFIAIIMGILPVLFTARRVSRLDPATALRSMS